MGGTLGTSHEDRAAALFHELDSHKTTEPALAQPMERVVARMIDTPVWFVLFWVVAAVAWYIGDFFGILEENRVEGIEMREIPDWLSQVSFLALIAVVFLMELIPIARSGQTFSKRRMRLRVVGPDGEAPGYRRAAIRWLLCWLPTALAFSATLQFLGTAWWYPAAIVTLATLAIPASMFFNNDRRGIHDRIAGTTVMVER